MNSKYEIFIYTGFLFLSVIISAFSQIILKKSAQKKYKNILLEYLNPYVVSGYFIFFAAVFLDMLALKKVPVSYIPVVESSSYIFVFIFSRIFLKEKFSARKFISIILILTGIAIFVAR